MRAMPAKLLFAAFLAVSACSGGGYDPPAGMDTLQFGVEQIRRSLELIIEYSVQQKLIQKRVGVDELFDEVTRELN